eukprot:m51a1_g2449 putative homoserine kinase (269) ;mRNA; r:887090-888446
MSSRSVSFRVPATTANMGPGFDCLGLALGLHLSVTVTVDDAPRASAAAAGPLIRNSGEGAQILPTDSSNLIYTSALRACELCGAEFPASRVTIEAHNELPLQAGLGSSSAAVVAGVLAADFAARLGLTRTRAAEIASLIEGHPDNASPAVLGGCVCAVCEPPRVFSPWPVRLARPESVVGVAVTPDMTVSTEEARKALPASYSRADIVHSVQRAASLVLALSSDVQQQTAELFNDVIHTPYRSRLVPGMPEILEFNKSIHKAPEPRAS